ncbi:MAG: NAD(P)H-hydrate epimerase [Candidatus Thalassarchaeaceae archaeon]
MANWVMHPAEVEVFDANARHLDISIQDLMQAAGQALAAETIRIVEASEAPEHREIWILCGSGNNGGDGFAAALSLHESGYTVRLIASHVTQKGEVG